MVPLLHIQSHHLSTPCTDTLSRPAQTVMWPLIGCTTDACHSVTTQTQYPGWDAEARIQSMVISTHPGEWLLMNRFFLVTPYRLFLFMTFTRILCPPCG